MPLWQVLTAELGVGEEAGKEVWLLPRRAAWAAGGSGEKGHGGPRGNGSHSRCGAGDLLTPRGGSPQRPRSPSLGTRGRLPPVLTLGRVSAPTELASVTLSSFPRHRGRPTEPDRASK